jgi:AcrR family transcriptional regulator
MAKDSKLNPRKLGLQSRAQETIDVILEATAQLLKEKGVKTISTNKIVEKAGVSIGTLYQYFPSKESVLSFLLEKQFNKTADDFLSHLDKLDFKNTKMKEGIEVILKTLFSHFEIKGPVFKELIYSVISLESLKFTLKNDERVSKAIIEKMKYYEDEIKVKDLNKAIFVILYCLKGVHFGRLFSNVTYTQDEMAKEMANLIYSYLVYDSSN